MIPLFSSHPSHPSHTSHTSHTSHLHPSPPLPSPSRTVSHSSTRDPLPPSSSDAFCPTTASAFTGERRCYVFRPAVTSCRLGVAPPHHRYRPASRHSCWRRLSICQCLRQHTRDLNPVHSPGSGVRARIPRHVQIPPSNPTHPHRIPRASAPLNLDASASHDPNLEQGQSSSLRLSWRCLPESSTTPCADAVGSPLPFPPDPVVSLPPGILLPGACSGI